MSTKKYHFLLWINILLLFGVTYARGEEFSSDKKKEISKSFAIKAKDQLYVDNRYGNITINHWNKNEISILVRIEVKAGSDKRVEEIMERISINIDHSGNTVSAITSLKNLNMNGNNERMNIHYFISMPSTLESSLTLRYGNISMPTENQGKCNIELKYGNIKAGDFTADLSINGAYSNIELGNLTNAQMNIAYCGKAVFRNANIINISSKYSNIEAGDINSLQLEKKYGNLTAHNINKASIEMKYSNANIRSIQQELKARTDYGTIDVEKVSANFTTIQASAKYGNLNLRIPSSTSFSVEAVRMKYGNVSIQGFDVTTLLPDENENIQKKGEKIRATINNGSNSKVIRFDGENYSNINIKSL